MRLFVNYFTLSHYSLRWILHDVWRVIFTVVGIALGVSIFMATLVAHRSVQVSFARTVEAFGGGGWWEVYSNSPYFSEEIIHEFKKLSSPTLVVPLVQVDKTIRCMTSIPEQSEFRRVNLVGIDALGMPFIYKRGDGLNFSSSGLIDFISNGNQVAIDARLKNCKKIIFDNVDTATQYSAILDIDSRLERIPVILQDISWVQDRIDQVGMVSRIYVKPSDLNEIDAMKAMAKLRGLIIQKVAERGDKFSKITEAFRINLLFLSTCALLVASYLVHSLLTFWCMKRRQDAIVLRSIGVDAATIRTVMLCEVSVIGALGGILGIILGIFMSKGMESIVNETVSALYQKVPIGQLVVEWWIIPLIMSLVFVVSILGGLGPASLLSRTPITVLKANNAPTLKLSNVGIRIFCGICMIAASIVFSLATRSSSILWIGLGTPLFFLIGAIILVPPVLRKVLDSLLLARAYLPVSVQLAIDHLSLTFSRSVGAVTALMISAGLFIAIDLMVSSFSGSLKSWLQEVLKADVYVSVDENNEKSISGISLNILKSLKSTPGVKDVDTAATVVAEYQGRPFQVTGVSFDILRYHQRLHMIQSSAKEEEGSDLPHVFVSEPFARWHEIVAGDVLKPLQSPLEFFVEGIYRDYSTENGVILIEDSLFKDIFPGVPLRSASLYLSDKVEIGKVISDIRSLPWEGEISIRSEKGLRSEIFRIFRATFRVTEILMWLTLCVALWVISNTITIMIAERGIELQTLRSIGATRNRLIGMIALEAGLLGLWGIAASILCGAGLALILVYIVNPFFFGWTLSPHWSWRIFLLLLVGVPVLTAAVGAIVASVIFRQPIQGIKYE